MSVYLTTAFEYLALLYRERVLLDFFLSVLHNDIRQRKGTSSR